MVHMPKLDIYLWGPRETQSTLSLLQDSWLPTTYNREYNWETEYITVKNLSKIHMILLPQILSFFLLYPLLLFNGHGASH